MDIADIELTKRIRDVIAVTTNDLDSVSFAVEDGVAYIEGVVPNEEQRRAVVRAVRNVKGLARVIVCLATEHVLPKQQIRAERLIPVPASVLMHDHSLS